MYLLRYLSDGRDRGSVQIVVVLSSFDEQVVLNVALHLLATCYEVVVTTVNFVIASRSGRVCRKYEQNLAKRNRRPICTIISNIFMTLLVY